MVRRHLVEQYRPPFFGVNVRVQPGRAHCTGSCALPLSFMASLLIQVITDETEIADLLFSGRDPRYAEERLHPFDGPPSLAEAFRLSGLCGSLGEARRLAAQGGAYVQGTRCADDGEFRARPMISGRYLLLRKGRRQVALLEVIPVVARITVPA